MVFLNKNLIESFFHDFVLAIIEYKKDHIQYYFVKAVYNLNLLQRLTANPDYGICLNLIINIKNYKI